jgi:hypothetical protein
MLTETMLWMADVGETVSIAQKGVADKLKSVVVGGIWTVSTLSRLVGLLADVVLLLNSDTSLFAMLVILLIGGARAVASPMSSDSDAPMLVS